MSQDRGKVGGDSDAAAAGDVPAAVASAPAGKRNRRSASVSPATKSQRRAAANEAKTVAAVPADLEADSDAPVKANRNPFVAIFRFFKQVIGELRKVIWPTRPQLVTYTVVVLAFLVLLTALVSGVDIGAGKLVDLVFNTHA